MSIGVQSAPRPVATSRDATFLLCRPDFGLRAGVRSNAVATGVLRRLDISDAPGRRRSLFCGAFRDCFFSWGHVRELLLIQRLPAIQMPGHDLCTDLGVLQWPRLFLDVRFLGPTAPIDSTASMSVAVSQKGMPTMNIADPPVTVTVQTAIVKAIGSWIVKTISGK